MTKSRLEGSLDDFIFLESPKVTIPFKKAEKTISVKGTSKRKAHKRKITFEGKVKEGDNKTLVNQYLAGMEHASRHLKKEPEITELSEKESSEWKAWQQYYKTDLFRPSVSPHEDYYSQAILVGSSPQHVKALISKYQAKDPSSMGVDLVADFEILYKRTKGDVPKKHNMDPNNLKEIRSLNESGLPGIVGGMHEEETYICRFKDGSKAIHKVMESRPVAGEVGTYEISKILNWNVIPETIQCDYGQGGGSVQKFIKDGEEPIDRFGNGIELTEKHFNDLSKIFILDMINGNNDRHNGNMVIDPNGKVWGIDNEGLGPQQAKIYMEILGQWSKTGDGNYIPMISILENSLGNDQRMFQKFKNCVDENLIRVRNHGNKIIDYWNKCDSINDECKKNIENNINYLSRYYMELNK